jgi:DNA polymerase-1
MTTSLILPDWVGSVAQDGNGLLTHPLVDLSGHQANYGYVVEMDALKALLDKLATEAKPMAFDIETGYLGMPHPKRSLDVHNLDQMIVGFSITNGPDWARYIPLHHDNTDLNMDPNQVWPMVKELFESGVADLVAHSWQFEGRNLRTLDIKGDGPDIIPARVHDTQIQSYVIGQAPPFGNRWHTLKQLTGHWFNYEQREITDLFASYAPKDKNGNPKYTKADADCLRFNTLPLDYAVQQYTCDDVTWCWRLDQFQRRNITENRWYPTAGRMYALELEILDLLVEMAGFGISVDWDGLAKGLEDYHVFQANMEQTARRMLAELVNDDYAAAFNFNSPPQVSRLLFDTEHLGLRPTQFTDTGNPSTADASLEAIRKQHPIVDMILKLRQVAKMGQWFEKWNGYRTGYDDKVHAALNQTRVQSGRFASDNPNVQNITKKWWHTSVLRDWRRYPANEPADEEFMAWVEDNYAADNDYWTGNARSYLVASPGYRFLSFDYAAQEMRVLAGLSQEPYLIEAFARGLDIHRATAAMMFSTPLEQVTPSQRRRGKTMNFALIYGQGPRAMAAALGISVEEAKTLMDQYFAAFTNVRHWMDRTKIQAGRAGYVTSFYGRRSTLWELFSDNEAIRSRGERKKINIPVQGGGADISKLAMLAARRVLRRRGWWGEPVRILMNQHDSLIFEVRDDLDMAAVIRLLEPAVMLTGLPELQAFPPMEVDWEVGLTWGDISTFTPEKETDSGGSMQVRFADGGFSVELSDADGAQQFDDWDEMTVVARFGKLSALAELLGSDYLFKHGDIEPIEYKQRVERLMPVVQPQAKAA